MNPNPIREALDEILKPNDDAKTTFATEESIEKASRLSLEKRSRMSRKISTMQSNRENLSPQVLFYFTNG